MFDRKSQRNWGIRNDSHMPPRPGSGPGGLGNRWTVIRWAPGSRQGIPEHARRLRGRNWVRREAAAILSR